MIEITITKDQKPCVVNIFDDIKNAVFYNLHKDRLGNIWTTTASGIYLLNRDKMSFELYNKSNNIHNQKYNYGHAFESSDGLVYFPGFNGVTYFDPSKFITTKEKVVVNFTSFKINGKSTMLNKSYDLSYDQNDIEISFKAPVINSNQGVKYKYRMKGLDPEWKLSNGVNTIRFSTLRAGTYVLLGISQCRRPHLVRYGSYNYNQYQSSHLYHMVVLYLNLCWIYCIILLFCKTLYQ